MIELLLIVDVITAISLIALVLLQQSKSSDMGAVFGGGSQTLFGSKGSANFLTRTTAILAIVFFAANIGLMIMISRQEAPESVTKSIVEKPAPKAVPKKAAKPQPKKGEKPAPKDIPVPE